MSMESIKERLAYIFANLSNVKQTGDGQWSAECPCHDDRNGASLAIGKIGRESIGVYCHADCATDAVMQAIGKTTAYLCPPRERTSRRDNSSGGFATAAEAIAAYEKTNGPRSKDWTYYNAAGEPAGMVLRWDIPDDKIVRPIARTSDGRWSMNHMAKPRPLYRQKEIAKAAVVVGVEGEKCVDAALKIGLEATTSAGGSKAAHYSDWSPLASKDVILCPDADEAGENYINEIRKQASKCSPPPKSIRIVRFDGFDDIADWVAAGGTREQFDKLASEAADVGTTEAPAETSVEAVQLIPASEFVAASYPINYIVEGVLVEGQNCVIGGPPKVLKTSIGLDLALSIASGTPFLNQFAVPKKRRVAFISGESGEGTIQETYKRQAFAHVVDSSQPEILFGFRLPCLGSADGLQSLELALDEHGIEVVVIDPLYLSLMGKETQNLNPANVFAMGPLLNEISDACKPHGTTPIILHHFSKGSQHRKQEFAPPELPDLAAAGVAEWARQWVLLGRRAAYQSNGKHHLHLVIGGSAGHSSAWALDIDEGVVIEGEAGRRWEVTLRTAHDESAARKQAAEAKKADDEKQKEDSLRRRVLSVLAALPDGETARVIAGKIGVTQNGKFTALLETMKGEGVLSSYKIKKRGNDCDCWQLRAIRATGATDDLFAACSGAA